MRICVFEDAAVKNLHPLTLTRPAFDLRCGAVGLMERLERCLPERVSLALVRPELADLCRVHHPHVQVWESAVREDHAEQGLVLLINARWLAPAEQFVLPDAPVLGCIGEQTAYAVVPARELRGLSLSNLAWRLAEWRHKLPNHPAGGRMIDYPWDLIEHNGPALEDDYCHWWKEGLPEANGVAITGPAERCLIAHSAAIDPMVHIDTHNGPVLIDRGAVVQSFSRIEGPCYIGAGTRILSARIHGGSIGPQCRIGGEVEASIVHGYSNKAHEGFLGHSYVGEWVNLAAGTQTSDLRTDYAPIRMTIDGKPLDTGMLKIGSFIGDHTKTSLNTLFNTGSLIGVFGQLLGSGELLPRLVPSFCQYGRGKLHERNALREMFGTAQVMMARRSREWTDLHAELFFTLFETTAGERRQLLSDGEPGRRRRVV
jgi:UDP-N-acetylglucosamine diphosphorylase / glucose-1-phosphate thymidylyltransferase / UDP-N-acetylgalactosamine diphosphorylase / glucosamine-1-phosphate N-acetyltransferase / galactosamine-1-phosphate N-acetyltransferase